MTELKTELARLDATAQAELVRSGEASAAELVEAAIARIEELNPAAQRRHPSALRRGSRGGAAASCPTGRSPGVPFLLKDLGRRLRGPAASYRHAGAQGRRLPGAVRHLPRPALPRTRASSRSARPTLPELGILPTTEPDAYGADAQPLGPRAHRRRLERRLRGGRRVGHGADRARQRRRRLDPHPGQRPAGSSGLKPTRQRISEGPMHRRQHLGADGCELVVSRSVRDTAAILDAVHGPGSGRPLRRRPPPARPYAEELERRARAAAHRRSRRSRSPDVEADPECRRRRLRGRGEAARVARPRGRPRTRPPASTGFDLQEHLPDALGGRTGRDAGCSSGRSLGRELGAGRRRAADAGRWPRTARSAPRRRLPRRLSASTRR